MILLDELVTPRRRTYGWDCPETYNGSHGLADTRGRCPYCRRKYESAQPMPHVPVSDLSESYDRFYNPDWGAE